ncbi:MAG: radical SAM protein [Pseudomonadota bacterium]
MENNWYQYIGGCTEQYRTFPSRTLFNNSVSEDDLILKYQGIDIYEPLSLYVHIPFCRQLCLLSGSGSLIEHHYPKARAYVDALIDEIAFHGKLLSSKGQPVSVHFGGGTPNYLICDDLADILTAIERHFGLTDSTDLSIELDPRLLRKADVDGLAFQGFNGLTLSIFDFDPNVQMAINRMQTFELIEASVSDIRSNGIEDLTFDLRYGLPRQTEESFEATLEKAISLSPDRISISDYTYANSTPPVQRKIDPKTLPDRHLRGRLAIIADEKLVSAGYVRVGFDHYAKASSSLSRSALSGQFKRSLQGFSADSAKSLIGFGVSAISFVDGLYLQNTPSVPNYLATVAAGHVPIESGLLRNKTDTVIANAIDDILCRRTTNISDVLNSAHPSDAIHISQRLEALEKDNLIEWRGDRILVSKHADAFSLVVATALDPYTDLPQKIAAIV